MFQPSRLTAARACLAAVAFFACLPGCDEPQARPLPAPQLPAEAKLLSNRPDRLMVQLENGLVVIAQEIPTAPVVSVHCWVKTGSIFEQEYNGKGLSHFLEHLASGGSTTQRPESESSKLLGQIGAETNAATSLDTVRYYINTGSENTRIAVDLMCDWMQNCKVDAKEFARERDVIQREFDMGRGEPGRIFWKATQLVRYRNHPARHPTIGYLDEFLSATRDELHDFYKRMYVPNNMVFVVAGKIDKNQVVEQVTRLWKDARPGKLPDVAFPEEAPVNEPRSATAKADIKQPRLRLIWPGVRLTGEHDYALDLLGQVLGQGELSRLVKRVRDKERMVRSIDAYNYSAAWGEGFFGVDADLIDFNTAEGKSGESERLDAVKAVVLEEIHRILNDGVSADELERAKRKTVAAAVYASQTAQETASRIASDFIHTGDPDYLQRYAKSIQKVDAKAVQAAAKLFLQDKRMMTITLLPTKEQPTQQKRPDDEKKIDYSGNLEKVDLDNQRLIAKFKQLQADQSKSAGAHVAPIKMFRLSNGQRLIVQRNTRLPVVAMQWFGLGGLLADEPGREGIAHATSRMMMRGAGSLSGDQIAEKLERLGAQMGTMSGNSTFSASAQCLAGDWPEVLSLLGTVVQEPTFPADEWSKLQPRLEAQIQSQNDIWYRQLRNEFRQSYYGDTHTWSKPLHGRLEVVSALTAKDLAAFHKTRYAADNSVLAVFGDVDPDQVKAVAEKAFAALPAKAAAPFDPPRHEKTVSRLVQVETPKPMAAVQIGYGPGIERSHPDYARLLVMNRVMDSFPVGRLDQALRGSGKGLVYAVGSGMMTGASPGYWAMLFNTSPKDLKEAMGAALAEVHKLRAEPVDDATLARARTKVLYTEASGNQSNSQRATSAALDEIYGVGYDASGKLISQIRAVDAAQIQAVARKYLVNPVAVIITNKKADPADLPPLSEAPEK